MPIEQDINKALDEFFRCFTPHLEGSNHTEDLEKTAHIRREMIKRIAEHVGAGAYLDMISGNSIVPLGILYLQEQGVMPGDTAFYITDLDSKVEELAKLNCDALGIPYERLHFRAVDFDPMGNWYFGLCNMDINGITLVNGSNFIPCPDLFFDATKRISPDLVIAQTGTADYIMDSLIINGYIANKSSYDVNSCNLDIVVCRRKDYIE